PLEGSDHVRGHGHAGKDLYRLTDIPEVSGAGNLVRHIDSVTRLQHDVGDVAGPPLAGTLSHDGPVGANYEDVLLVGSAGGTAGLPQVPSRALAAVVSNRGGVVDLTRHHDERRPLGDMQCVPGTDFDIGGSVLPLFNRCADVDEQAAAGWDLLDLRNKLLSLACRPRAFQPWPAHPLVLQAGYHLIPILSGKFPNLTSFQDRSVRIGLGRESPRAPQNRTESFGPLDTVSPGMQDLAAYADRAAKIVPAADLPNCEDVTGLENNIGIRLTRQRPADGDRAMLELYVISVHDRITREVGLVPVCVALEAPGKTQQLGSGHAVGHWVFAG